MVNCLQVSLFFCIFAPKVRLDTYTLFDYNYAKESFIPMRCRIGFDFLLGK
jgi:hypothetical protein